MNKEQIQELMMGVAMVGLAYALYKHFKPVASALAARPSVMPFDARQPANYDPTYGAPYDASTLPGFMKLADIMHGAVNENVNYTNGGYDYLDQITDPLLNNNGGNESVVKAGGYW